MESKVKLFFSQNILVVKIFSALKKLIIYYFNSLVATLEKYLCLSHYAVVPYHPIDGVIRNGQILEEKNSFKTILSNFFLAF